MKMEPNNLENQFREKLNQREISPSEKAWDRLDAMLTVAEKPKRNFRWMYVAASFLGFLLIATVFLSQTDEVIDSKHNKVVLEQKQVHENTTRISLDDALENKATEKVAVSQKPIVKEDPNGTTGLKSPLSNIEKSLNQVASAAVPTPNTPVLSTPKTGIKVDPNTLLASVDTQKSAASLAHTLPVKVNSHELLTEVDSELELSFRERVLQSVNKKYREVKVAVVNRNVE